MRLYLSDGTFEDLWQTTTVKTDTEVLDDYVHQFGAILSEKLGSDFEQCFYGLLAESKDMVEMYYTDGDGAYESSEEYMGVLRSAEDCLDEASKQIDKMLTGKVSRLQLQDISKRLKSMSREIDNSI